MQRIPIDWIMHLLIADTYYIVLPRCPEIICGREVQLAAFPRCYDDILPRFPVYTSFKEIKKIDVGINLHRIKIDKRGYLYVSSRGDYYDTPPNLYVIDTRTEKVVKETASSVHQQDRHHTLQSQVCQQKKEL